MDDAVSLGNPVKGGQVAYRNVTAEKRRFSELRRTASRDTRRLTVLLLRLFAQHPQCNCFVIRVFTGCP